LKTVAESRKNMRIDMRPKVLAKTMTRELIILGIALTMAFCNIPNWHYRPTILLFKSKTYVWRL